MPISDDEYIQLARDAAEALAMWQDPMTDWQLRNVVVTPFRGAYGTAGLIFALEGTPPRALAALLPSEDQNCSLEALSKRDETIDWRIVLIPAYPWEPVMIAHLADTLTDDVIAALRAFATAWWADYMERQPQ